jgi:hypothetical protein
MVGGGPFGPPPLLFLLAFLPALWTIWAIWPTGRVVFAGVFAWALGHLTQITVYGLFPDPQRLRDLPVADLRLQCLDRRRRMKWRKCATGRQRTPTATRAAEVAVAQMRHHQIWSARGSEMVPAQTHRPQPRPEAAARQDQVEGVPEGRPEAPLAEAKDAEEIMSKRANVFLAVFMSILSLGMIVNAVAYRVQENYAMALVTIVVGTICAIIAAGRASWLVDKVAK